MLEFPSGSLGAELFGTAVALGDSTLALGTITLTAAEWGQFAVARGSAEFTAVAETSDGSTPYADADTSAVVTGADAGIIAGISLNLMDGDTTVSTSKTNFVAADIGGWIGGPSLLVSNISSSMTVPNLSLSLEGDLAHVDVVSTAFGSDTLASTLALTQVIDDQFSAAFGAAQVGVA